MIASVAKIDAPCSAISMLWKFSIASSNTCSTCGTSSSRRHSSMSAMKSIATTDIANSGSGAWSMQFWIARFTMSRVSSAAFFAGSVVAITHSSSRDAVCSSALFAYLLMHWQSSSKQFVRSIREIASPNPQSPTPTLPDWEKCWRQKQAFSWMSSWSGKFSMLFTMFSIPLLLNTCSLILSTS